MLDASLVDLDDAVDFPNEPEAREEANGARQQIEEEHHDERVAEIEETGRIALDLQLGIEIMTAVEEQVHRREARSEIGPPPPVVILSAQMEITQQDCGLRACDHQNNENKEKKTEHIVHLWGPDRVKDEKELNEDTTKREHTAHDNTRHGFGIDGLLGNQAWDLIGAYRVFECALAETEIRADKRQRNGNQEPKG